MAALGLQALLCGLLFPHSDKEVRAEDARTYCTAKTTQLTPCFCLAVHSSHCRCSMSVRNTRN